MESIEIKEYNPYSAIADGEEEGVNALEDSDNPNGSSENSALFHVICVIAGTGILQLPYALSKSGWIGIALMILSAFVNEYTGRLLIQCLYVDGRRLTGYPDIGNYAYGPIGRAIVNFFYNSVLIGVTTLYLILSGYNIQSLIGYLSQREWIILCGGIIWLPFILLRTLKEVSIVSLFGALASVLLVVIIIGLGLSDQSPKPSASHDFIHFDSLATSICIIAFSFGGNFVYPEVEQSMSKPSKFPHVLRKAMIVITIMYLISSVIGYAVYGNAVQSPITESLPKGVVNTICQVVVTIHVLLACPVLMTTFALDIERAAHLDKEEESSNEYIQRIALRSTSIMGVTLLAIVIPFFKDFMTLVGAMTNTMLIFIFPVVFHYKIFGASHVSIWEHIFRGFIILLGSFSGLVGGWQAIRALYYDFLNTGAF